MPLDVTFIHELGSKNMAMYEAKERLYLNADKTAIVPESEGAYLLVGKGGSIPMADAEKYGLVSNTSEPEPEVTNDDDGETAVSGANDTNSTKSDENDTDTDETRDTAESKPAKDETRNTDGKAVEPQSNKAVVQPKGK